MQLGIGTPFCRWSPLPRVLPVCSVIHTTSVALHLSLDAVQLPNVSDYENTPMIFLNLNLPPDERYKVNNILTSLLIPGPKKPKLLDTFFTTSGK
jgi:hypothetical protein